MASTASGRAFLRVEEGFRERVVFDFQRRHLQIYNFKKKKKMNQFELIKSVESVNTSIASKLMRETLLQSTVGMNCACAICKCAGYFGCRVNLINFNCN